MQQASNIQVPLNAGQQVGYQMYPPNSNQQYPPQLGMQPGPGYQYDPYAANPPTASYYQSQYPMNTLPQNSIKEMEIANLETMISSFGCYTCVLYYDLISNWIIAYFVYANDVGINLFILTLIYVIVIIIGFVFALRAKAKLCPTRQLVAFICFVISAIMGLVSDILNEIKFNDLSDIKCPYNDEDRCFMYGINYVAMTFAEIGNIVAHVIISVILLTSGYKLLNLMKKRKAMLQEHILG